MVAAEPPPAAASARRCSRRPSDWARGAGVRKLELHVFPHNEPALALYEQFGFRARATARRHYHSAAGAYLDAILMAYTLE